MGADCHADVKQDSEIHPGSGACRPEGSGEWHTARFTLDRCLDTHREMPGWNASERFEPLRGMNGGGREAGNGQ
jgi:hypothetical protein